jgi:hypothetical protein
LGSAARGLPQEEIQQREQLKQLRSRLENLQSPDEIEAIERECNQLIAQIQNKPIAAKPTPSNAKATATTNVPGDRPPAKPDLRQDLSKYQSILSVAESKWIKETENMATQAAPPSTTDLAELKNQLAPVVEQAVQQTVQQVLERTLPVERALMIAEVTANCAALWRQISSAQCPIFPPSIQNNSNNCSMKKFLSWSLSINRTIEPTARSPQTTRAGIYSLYSGHPINNC